MLREQKAARQAMLDEAAVEQDAAEKLADDRQQMAAEDAASTAERAVEMRRKRDEELLVWGKVVEYFERRHKKEGLTLRGLFEELDEKGDQIVSPEAFIRRMIRHGVKIARAEMLELLRALDPNDEGVLFFGPFSRSLRRNRQALRQKRYEEMNGTGADHLPPTAQATMLK